MAALIPSQLYGADEEKPADRGSLLGSAALAVGSSIARDVVAPAAELLGEVTGDHGGAIGTVAKTARNVGDKVDTYIPPERLADRDAAFIPEEGQRSVFKNPGSSLVMKLASSAAPMVPIIAAGPYAPVVGGLLGVGTRISEVNGLIEKASEDELLKTYPKYVEYMTLGLPEHEARKLLVDDMLKGTMVPAAAGGAAGAFAYSRALRLGGGRGIAKGTAVGAAEGAAGGALEGGGREVSNQQGEMNVGKRVDYNPVSITNAMLNAGLEGGVLGGGMGVAGGAFGKAHDKALDLAATQLDKKKARDAAKVDGDAPDPAQTEALTPDGPTALDAQIDAAAAGSPDALKPSGTTPPPGAPPGATPPPAGPSEAVVNAIHAAATKRTKAMAIHDAVEKALKALGVDAPPPTEVVKILAGMKASGELSWTASGGYRTTRPAAPKTPPLAKTPVTVVEATEAAKPPETVVTKRNVPGEEASAVAAGVEDVIRPPPTVDMPRGAPEAPASLDFTVTSEGKVETPAPKKDGAPIGVNAAGETIIEREGGRRSVQDNTGAWVIEPFEQTARDARFEPVEAAAPPTKLEAQRGPKSVLTAPPAADALAAPVVEAAAPPPKKVSDIKAKANASKADTTARFEKAYKEIFDEHVKSNDESLADEAKRHGLTEQEVKDGLSLSSKVELTPEQNKKLDALKAEREKKRTALEAHKKKTIEKHGLREVDYARLEDALHKKSDEAFTAEHERIVSKTDPTPLPPKEKAAPKAGTLTAKAAPKTDGATAGEAKTGVKVVSRKIPLTADDIKIRNAVKAKLPGEGSDDTARKVAAVVKTNMKRETAALAEHAKLQDEAAAKAAAEAKTSGKPSVFKRTELPPETPEARLERHVEQALTQHRENEADAKRTKRNVKKDANEEGIETLARDYWNADTDTEARKALGGDGEARRSVIQRVRNMLALAADQRLQLARDGFRTDRPEESNTTPWRKYLWEADKFNKEVESALREKDPTEKARQLNEAFTEFLTRETEARGGKELTKETVTPKGKSKVELDAELKKLTDQQKLDAAKDLVGSKKVDDDAPQTSKRDALDEQAAKDDGAGLNPDDYGDGRATAARNGAGLHGPDSDFQKNSGLLIRSVLTKRVASKWAPLREHLSAVWDQLNNYERGLHKAIFDKLDEYVSDGARVFVVPDAVWDSHGLQEAGGFHMPHKNVTKDGIVFLPERQAYSPQVVAHESAHAVTERAIHYSPEFKKEVEQLMRDILASLPEGGARQKRLNKQYGYHNAAEFIAEVHANPQFRDMLAAIKLKKPIVTPTGTLRTMWDKFVNSVKDLLGIKNRLEYTALERAMMFADDAMYLDGAIREDATVAVARGANTFVPPKYEGSAVRPGLVDAADVRPSPVRDFFEERIPAKIDWKLRTQRMLDKVASVVQMTNNSDHLFGEDRPARQLAEAMGKMATMKDKIVSEKAEPLIKNMHAAQRKFDQRVDGRSAWTDFATLMHDASRAGVHPDVPIDVQFKKDNTRNWYQQEVHKDLSARYEKMDPELKALFHEATGYFRETQNQMSLGLIRNALKAASPDGKGSEALAQRIFNKKLTDADKAVLGKDGLLSSIQKAGALSRIEGPYVPFMRRGDFVVTARHEIATPAGARRINDEEAVDPKGNTYEFKTEDAARDFVKKTLTKAGLRPTAVDKVGVDPTTESHYRVDAEGKKKALNIAEEPNAEARWRVTVEPKHVEFHERASDAAESRQGLIDKGLQDVTHVDVKKLDPAKMNDAFMPLQMQRMLNALQKREGFKKLDKNAQAELVRQLHEAGIAAMGTTRAQSHRLPRNNILGYSEDILRNTGAYASSTSGYLARLRYRPDVDAALKAMTDYTEKMTRAGNDEYIPALRRQRLNELTKRAHAMNEVDADNMFHRVTSRLLQLSYLDKLASPAFHVINSSEPWTITLPVLAARHGVLPTMKALSSAYNLIGGRTIIGAGMRDTYRAGKHGYHADLTDYQTTLTQRVAKDAEHGEGLVKLFNHLHDVGLMSRDAGMEFSRITDASKGLAGRSVDRADLMARQVGAAVESVNRAVSATAAYKMERRKGATHEKAMEYAVEQVHDTMKDYASWNAPPIFNHPVGRLALQFKKYAQGTYYLLGKTAVASFKGDKQAMKTFAYLMATHMVTAGALGMPLEPIRLGLMAAGLLGITDKTYEDFEQGVRAGGANVLGVEGGQIFTRGLARWAGIDLASRVSFNSLLTSGQDPKSMKPDDLWAWIAKNFAGAPASLLIDGVQGFQALGKGDVVEASRLLVPLKIWADSVQAYQWNTEGKKSASGRQQMDPVSFGDALIKASGFTPGNVAERNEKTFAIKGDQRQFKKARDQLSNDWINASPDEKMAMWREIEKWNAGQPANAKIKMNDLMNQKRRRDQEKFSDDRAGGMNLSKRDRHLLTTNDYYNVSITR